MTIEQVRKLKRGDLVLATVVGGDKVERRVWEVLDFGKSVAICTPETYQEAVDSGERPVTVGFRPQWIEPVPVDTKEGE